MKKNEFQSLVKKKPLILDGATGSNLRLMGMPAGVCTEKWVNENPQVIQKLQKQYVEAGSMVVYAPTFLANPFSMKSLGLESEVRRLNMENVKISKEAVGNSAFVAGDISTTSQPLEPFGTMTYEALLDIYKEQISCLCEAGVDYLAAETLLSLDEAMVICDAAAFECDLPLTISFTCEGDGNLYFGGNITEAAVVLQEMGAAAVGVNCSVGPDQLEAVVRNLKQNLEIPILVKPNAGVPLIDEKGRAHYSMDADRFAAHMKNLRDCGASVVGGCCGTTPEYIKKMYMTLG
ncbi:MAG: homocysteine S-methyltransferase family protein [Lachnospiraceae bacterium]